MGLHSPVATLAPGEAWGNPDDRCETGAGPRREVSEGEVRVVDLSGSFAGRRRPSCNFRPAPPRPRRRSSSRRSANTTSTARSSRGAVRSWARMSARISTPWPGNTAYRPGHGRAVGASLFRRRSLYQAAQVAGDGQGACPIRRSVHMVLCSRVSSPHRLFLTQVPISLAN